MTKKYIFLLPILVSILSSCTSVRYLAIDVYEPAKVSLPPEIAYVSIVDNARTYSMEEHQALVADENSLLIPADSAKRTFLKTFSNLLNEQKYFQEVSVYPYQMRTDNDYFQEKLLPFSQIRSISREADVDAIISLDDFIINGIIYEVEDPYLGRYQGLALNLVVKIRTYTEDGTEFTQPIVLNDTVYQEGSLSSFVSAEWLSAQTDWMAMLGAETLIKQFTPYWETQDRAYFSNVKDATSLVSKNKWQEAIALWETEYDKVKGEEKQAQIAFNLALANECMDQVKKANDWIEISIKFTPFVKSESVRRNILSYQKILQQRKAALEKLEIQIGIVEGDDTSDL